LVSIFNLHFGLLQQVECDALPTARDVSLRASIGGAAFEGSLFASERVNQTDKQAKTPRHTEHPAKPIRHGETSAERLA
jgi:hypothetical protein